MKQRIKPIIITPKVQRNEMHFEVQRRTKMQIFKDKTKYTRKVKHKQSYI